MNNCRNAAGFSLLGSFVFTIINSNNCSDFTGIALDSDCYNYKKNLSCSLVSAGSEFSK